MSALGTPLSSTGTGPAKSLRHAAKRLAAVPLLAAGLSYDDIAERIRVTKRTIVAWNADAAFAAEVARARSAILEQTAGLLAGEALATVKVLVTLRDRGEVEGTRLGACRTILDKLVATRELVELEQRLGAIEATLALRGPPAPGQRPFPVAAGARAAGGPA